MYVGIDVEYPLFLSNLSDAISFLPDLKKKKYQISNVMKIGPMGAELFHGDRLK